MARDRERDVRITQGGRGESESANLDAAAGTTGGQGQTGRSAQGGSTSGGSADESGWGTGAQGESQGLGQGTQRSSFYSRASERLSRRSQGSTRFGAQGGYGAEGGAASGQGAGAGSYGQGGYAGGYGATGRSQGELGSQRGYQGGRYQTGGYQGAGSQGGGLQSGYQGGYQGSQQGGYQSGDRGASQGPEGREWREQGYGRSGGQAGGEIASSGRGEGSPSDERGGDRDWPNDQYSRQVGGGYQAAGGAAAAGAAGFATGYGAGRGYAGAERDASADVGLGYRDFGEGREAGRRTRWQREPSTARDIMTKNPKSVTRNASVRDIAQIMRDESTGIVPVVEENGKLLGVVTDRDIVMRALAEGRNPLDLSAADVMTDDVEAVTPDESLREVVDLMGNKQIRRVPVVDQNDRLVGIISMGDLATRADYDEELQDALEEISARRSFWSRLFA